MLQGVSPLYLITYFGTDIVFQFFFDLSHAIRGVAIQPVYFRIDVEKILTLLVLSL